MEPLAHIAILYDTRLTTKWYLLIWSSTRSGLVSYKITLGERGSIWNSSVKSNRYKTYGMWRFFGRISNRTWPVNDFHTVTTYVASFWDSFVSRLDADWLVVKIAWTNQKRAPRAGTKYNFYPKMNRIINKFWMLKKLLRDAQRIVKWRSFYLKTLHPLDVEAVKLIKENTHLYYQVCGIVT